MSGDKTFYPVASYVGKSRGCQGGCSKDGLCPPCEQVMLLVEEKVRHVQRIEGLKNEIDRLRKFGEGA